MSAQIFTGKLISSNFQHNKKVSIIQQNMKIYHAFTNFTLTTQPTLKAFQTRKFYS